MAQSIRVSDDLYLLAQAEARRMSLSLAQQIEHWAKLGLGFESSGVGLDDVRSATLRARLCQDELDASEGRISAHSLIAIPESMARNAKVTLPETDAEDPAVVVTKKKIEAITPPELVERALRWAGDSVVLIGGQALGFWMQRYGIRLPDGLAAISRDVGFLAPSPNDLCHRPPAAVAIKGQAIIPSRRALTALVGQAVADVSADEYINIDVLFDVVGISPEAVMKRSVRIEAGETVFRVMHPLDVLRSRLANLHRLPAKSSTPDKLLMSLQQLQANIEVVRAFLRAQAATSSATNLATGRSPLQAWVSEIERLAIEDAARKAAARHALHVADAIDPSLIPAGPFWDKRWPALKALMSPRYAARFTPPIAPGFSDDTPQTTQARRRRR